MNGKQFVQQVKYIIVNEDQELIKLCLLLNGLMSYKSIFSYIQNYHAVLCLKKLILACVVDFFYQSEAAVLIADQYLMVSLKIFLTVNQGKRNLFLIFDYKNYHFVFILIE